MKALGRGRASTVLDLGDGRVLRRGGNPEREARVMEHAREHGYPVPRVFERRPDALVLERIAGRTMLDDLARRPWRLRSHVRTLADLHHRLHAIAAPPDLRSAGEGNALLHLDLHPMNVLLSARGPVVIDWTNAHRGDPAMDVALTWLLGMTAEIPIGYGRLLARLFSRDFANAVGVEEVRAGLAEAADFRLRDANVLESESRRIERLLE